MATVAIVGKGHPMLPSDLQYPAPGAQASSTRSRRNAAVVLISVLQLAGGRSPGAVE